MGIARTGGYTGHGSGEVMIGFTTANRIPSGAEEELLQIQAIPEHVINRAFLAAAEAEQEAILNSMTAAEPRTGGRTLLQFVRVPGRSGFETVTNLCRQSTETV